MSADLDSDLTLQLARLAGEPSTSDQERNLQALRARLGTAQGPGPAGGTSAGARSSARATGTALAGVAQRGLRRGASLQQLVLVGALTGALGYWLGLSQSTQAPELGPPGNVPSSVPQEISERGLAATDPLGAARAVAGAERATAAGPRVLDVAGANAETEAAAAERAAAKRVAPEPVAAGPIAVGAAPSVAPRAPTRDPARAAVAPRASGPSRATSARSEGPDFRAAVRLLARAQRAIDAGDASLGMSLLAELDARFPREVLSEERQAARVLAWCASGETDRAVQAARELDAQNAGSIYGPRLARSCVALAAPEGTAPAAGTALPAPAAP